MTGSQTSVGQESSCKPHVQFIEPNQDISAWDCQEREGQGELERSSSQVQSSCVRPSILTPTRKFNLIYLSIKIQFTCRLKKRLHFEQEGQTLSFIPQCPDMLEDIAWITCYFTFSLHSVHYKASGIHQTTVMSRLIPQNLMQRPVEITDCFSSRHGFNSQHLHICSQVPATPVLGSPMLSPGLLRYQAWMWYTDTHADKTPSHLKQSESV